MNENLEREHSDGSKKRYPSKEAEIADVLRKKAEIMKQDIALFTRLAEYYYGTADTTDYSTYTGEEVEIGNGAHLYTLIKYQGKDVAVQVGTGEFNTAVFTRRNIPELIGLSHGPLPLFVVAAWADQEDKESNPRKFLNESVEIYSPRGGQVDVRMTHKQKEHAIDYGKSNGIMNYEDAVLALQNAEIHKLFPNDTMFEKFIHKMKELKNMTHEELQKRINRKEEFQKDRKPEEKMLRDNILSCLSIMSNDDPTKKYELIQSFDLHKHTFIKIQ